MNPVYLNFQDLWNKCFLLFLGSCAIKKTCVFVVMGIVKKTCGLQVGWAEIIRQTVSFFVCVCACVCGVEGGLGKQNQASDVALQAKY